MGDLLDDGAIALRDAKSTVAISSQIVKRWVGLLRIAPS
jgi:hypothetical protein